VPAEPAAIRSALTKLGRTPLYLHADVDVPGSSRLPSGRPQVMAGWFAWDPLALFVSLTCGNALSGSRRPRAGSSARDLPRHGPFKASLTCADASAFPGAVRNGLHAGWPPAGCAEACAW
jgi:hypothetical protein